MLLGVVALRTGQGKRIDYDGEAGKITNVAQANEYLRREPRKGWVISPAPRGPKRGPRWGFAAPSPRPWADEKTLSRHCCFPPVSVARFHRAAARGPSPQPSPKGRGSQFGLLAQPRRYCYWLPLPRGEGWGEGPVGNGATKQPVWAAFHFPPPTLSPSGRERSLSLAPSLHDQPGRFSPSPRRGEGARRAGEGAAKPTDRRPSRPPHPDPLPVGARAIDRSLAPNFQGEPGFISLAPTEAFRLLGEERKEKWPPRILRVLAIWRWFFSAFARRPVLRAWRPFGW